MTMELMRHGTPRAGFKGWPSEDNVPGTEEQNIAQIAYPDPNFETTLPPRTYENRGKTPTGEAIAMKSRDIRLRTALTGSTKMPRLGKKTNPKALGAEEEANFEEELKAYEEGAFSAPGWMCKAVKEGRHMKEVNAEHQSSIC